MAGRYDEAEHELSLAEQLGGGSAMYDQYQWVRLDAALGRQSEARSRLTAMKALAARDRRLPFAAIAAAHMALGDADSALALLEPALETRDIDLPSYLTREDTLFDPIRSSPRFRRVVEGVGFPDAEALMQPWSQ